MAFWNRTRTVDDDERVVGRDHEVVEGTDRGRYARGFVRGWFTLVGVAAAGFLTWLAAHSFTPPGSTSDFWVAMGLIAGAGLALGLSQLFGGWTKWGVPRISSGVLFFGWIPTAIVAGWILLTIQPDGGWQQSRLESWSDSIGVLGFVRNFAEYPGVVAIALGLVTAFVFDTTGPRTRRVDTVEHRERVVPDEDVHAYRTEDTGSTRVEQRVPAGTTTTTSDRPVETRRDTP
jgi:hypothetical protein